MEIERLVSLYIPGDVSPDYCGKVDPFGNIIRGNFFLDILARILNLIIRNYCSFGSHDSSVTNSKT